MKFYYMTKSKGKCGCVSTRWGVTEDFGTKAEVKRAKGTSRTSVKGVWTKEELVEVWGENNANKFVSEARAW